MRNVFQAGAAQQIITPPLGTIVNGDFYQRYAHSIHDDLFAKALVLDDGQICLVIAIVDVCSMSQEFIDGIKGDINLELSIPTEQILIASNHTHGSGSTEELYLTSIDSNYRHQLPNLIMAAVRSAYQKRQPAKICFGSEDVPQHLLCRRYFMQKEYKALNPISGQSESIKTNPFNAGHLIEKPVSGTDPQLSYLAVKSLDNKWIGILGNYSMHYAGDWEPGTITADYFGTFAGYLQKDLKSEELVAMMSSGTGGDINNWDFQKNDKPALDFSQSDRIGRDLASTVANSLLDAKWDENPHLNYHHESLSLQRHKPDKAICEEAKKITTEARFEARSYDDTSLRSIYAREQILMSEMPYLQTCPLQAFQIGQLVIGALPGEFFAETGLWLKNKFLNIPYFSICLANGNVGYVPPPHQFKLGGYETWRCRYSSLNLEAEPILRKAMVSLIQSMLDLPDD